MLLLRNAIVQSHPQVATTLPDPLDVQWLHTVLRERIETIDFVALKNDALPFVEDGASLSLWSKNYFNDKLDVYFAAAASVDT